MAEQKETDDQDKETQDLRGKMISRLAMAGVLVAMLLGVLAFFDRLANPPEESDSQVFTDPVPVAPKKEVSQPVTPAEILSPPPVTETVHAESPPPPVVEVQPSVEGPEKSAPVAESGREKTTAKASKKLLPEPPQPAHHSEPVPEGSALPSRQLPAQVSEQVPLPETVVRHPQAHVVDTKPAPAVVAPSAPRLFSGFLLQAGVFSSVQRAEELHAKLSLNGIPTTLETRVQVGPFRTKREAEATQAKLKELGIDTILVPPKGKN